jgi:hypothetical protein
MKVTLGDGSVLLPTGGRLYAEELSFGNSFKHGVVRYNRTGKDAPGEYYPVLSYEVIYV